jgi:hypothetical protein
MLPARISAAADRPTHQLRKTAFTFKGKPTKTGPLARQPKVG